MIKKVTVDGLAKLPAFCHATIAGDFVYVSGTLGALPNSMDVIKAGIGPETKQTLENIEVILKACDVTWAEVVKVNVFIADMKDFAGMNEAYLEIVEYFYSDGVVHIFAVCHQYHVKLTQATSRIHY